MIWNSGSPGAWRWPANSSSISTSMKPDPKLLVLLNTKSRVKYAPLPESNLLQEELAVFVGLEKDVAFYDIAEKFVNSASNFLADIEKGAKLSPVKLGRVSLGPSSFAH